MTAKCRTQSTIIFLNTRKKKRNTNVFISVESESEKTNQIGNTTKSESEKELQININLRFDEYMESEKVRKSINPQNLKKSSLTQLKLKVQLSSGNWSSRKGKSKK